MAHNVDDVIAMLAREPGPECARMKTILEREKANGMLKMSLGTWAPGHPANAEEWARCMADVFEGLANQTPKERAAAEREGEMWGQLDSLECEKSWLIQFLGALAVVHPATRADIDRWLKETFKGDDRALALFHLGQVLNVRSEMQDDGTIIHSFMRREATAPTQVGTPAKTNLADEAQQKECP